MTGRLGGLVLALALACGDDAMSPRDAAIDGTTDCSDGLFCNGVERYMPGAAGADARGCVAGAPMDCLEGQSCSEELARCVTTDCTMRQDADMDGVDSVDCGGFDCDDADPRRAPGLTEFCDTSAHDEDCDLATFGVRDGDMDGFADSTCCNDDGTSPRACGTDCDDTRSTANPATAEVCNGFDDDCDGAIDEATLTTYTIDADRDGHGAEGGDTVESCSRPAGYADSADDCDDADSGRNPGVDERCEPAMVDDDCDDMANEDCSCSDGMTRDCTLPGRCAGSTETCVGGTWSTSCSTEPIAETCNTIDDDCDGATDETLTIDCFPDPDRDGYASADAVASARCPVGGGCGIDWTARTPSPLADCREGDPMSYPGAVERCDVIDNDCSSGGAADLSEDADADGHAPSVGSCAGGLPADDCEDTVFEVHPGQMRFFDARYCPGGMSPCAFCAGACAPDDACSSITCGPAPSYDYNCSGANESPPSDADCFAENDRCALVADNCGRPGLLYGSPAACGDLVEDVRCGECTGRCAAPLSVMIPLPCH